MRINLLSMCALALPLVTGCEALIPLIVASTSGGSDPEITYPYTEDGEYLPMDQVPIDVTLLDASGMVGGLDLAALELEPSGFVYGTSTHLQISAPDPSQSDELGIVDIFVELCPIEDVIENGETTTAFVALTACNVETGCYDASPSMDVLVEEDELGVRTIEIDYPGPDGEPVHLALEYPPPTELATEGSEP